MKDAINSYILASSVCVFHARIRNTLYTAMCVVAQANDSKPFLWVVRAVYVFYVSAVSHMFVCAVWMMRVWCVECVCVYRVMFSMWCSVCALPTLIHTLLYISHTYVARSSQCRSLTLVECLHASAREWRWRMKWLFPLKNISFSF